MEQFYQHKVLWRCCFQPAAFNPYSKCGYNYVPFGNYIDPQERHKFFATMTMKSVMMLRFMQKLHTQLRADYYGSPSYPPYKYRLFHSSSYCITWISRLESKHSSNTFSGLQDGTMPEKLVLAVFTGGVELKLLKDHQLFSKTKMTLQGGLLVQEEIYLD